MNYFLVYILTDVSSVNLVFASIAGLSLFRSIHYSIEVPVFTRTVTCLELEQIAEMLGILKTQRIADFADGVGGIKQAVFGFFDQENVNAFLGGFARFPF